MNFLMKKLAVIILSGSLLGSMPMQASLDMLMIAKGATHICSGLIAIHGIINRIKTTKPNEYIKNYLETALGISCVQLSYYFIEKRINNIKKDMMSAANVEPPFNT